LCGNWNVGLGKRTHEPAIKRKKADPYTRVQRGRPY
jgi:hypothetical protein